MSMFSIVKQLPEPGLQSLTQPAAPQPGFGEVKIAVLKAGICGTDYHIYRWDAWSANRVPTPMIIGHEFVGRIEAIGPGVNGLEIGQRVSAECHLACGHCVQCRTGQAHLCREVAIVGVDRPGCFAETITVPAVNVWPIPKDIPDEHAAVYDPAGNAMHAVSAVPVAGADVLVVGAGTIGLFAIAMALGYGAQRVIVEEPNPFRANLASTLGATMVLDPRRPGTEDHVRAATDGQGPGVVLEMSGNADGLRRALKVARNGAHVALLGLPDKPLHLDLGEDVIMKGLTLHGITGRRMFDTWYRVDAFMRRHPNLVSRIITHVLPAESFAEGFELMEQGRCGKVVLDFGKVASRSMPC
jgi:threonine 3-dehydrogenase